MGFTPTTRCSRYAGKTTGVALH